MATRSVSATPTGWMSGPRKTCCASAKCCGRDNTSRIRGQWDRRRDNAVQSQSGKLNLETQSSCREEGNEKTRVTNSSDRMDRGDSGAGMPVRRGGAGPATDLLGMADREQPFHECAV